MMKASLFPYKVINMAKKTTKKDEAPAGPTVEERIVGGVMRKVTTHPDGSVEVEDTN
jgi:hypothetical protein